MRHSADVFVTAGFDCFQTDHTVGDHLQPHPGFRFFVHDELRIADSCGTATAGPAYAAAETRIELRPDGTNGPWRAYGLAIVADGLPSDGNGAESRVQFFDRFQIVSTDPDMDVGDDAELTVRIPFTATLENSTQFVEWEFFAPIYRVNANGSLSPLELVFENRLGEDGTVSEVLEQTVVGARVGDTLEVGFGGTLALALMGDFAPVGASPKRAEIEAEFSLCSTADVSIVSASGAGHDCGQCDLELVDVELVQSVREATRVVAGKDTVVRLVVKSTCEEPVAAEVALTFPPAAGLPRVLEETVEVPAGCPENEKVFYFPGPQVIGEECDPSNATGGLLAQGLAPTLIDDIYSVSATIEPTTVSDADPTNNEAASPPLPVKDAGIAMSYVEIEPPTGTYAPLNPTTLEQAIFDADFTVSAMFPVSQEGFSSETCNLFGGTCTVTGSGQTCQAEPCSPSDDGHCYNDCVDGMCLGCPGIDDDRSDAESLMDAVDPFADRAVVMVPHDYFDFHGLPPQRAGITNSPFTVFVRAASEDGPFPVPVTAHELVHTFEPHPPLSAGDPGHRTAVGNPGFVQPTGYWVGCEEFVGASCEIAPGAQNLMEPVVGIDPPGVWIDREVYEEIVLAGLTVTPDPSVLFVQGSVGAGDSLQAEILGMREHAAGTLTRPATPEDSNFKIVLVDDAGNDLVSLPYVEFSTVIADGFVDGPTTFHTRRTAFAVKMPYPADAARLQIVKQGQVIADVDPLAESLRRMIERIPDRGLKNPAANRRETLLEKVDQFEGILEHNKGAALNKLDNDLRAHVEKWVLDIDPLVVSPTSGKTIYTGDVTRAEVLEQIDRVRARVHHRME